MFSSLGLPTEQKLAL